MSNLKLIIFDLDYTLWPFWVDTHVTPPFKKNGRGDIVDAHGQKIKIYPEVPKILETLHNEGYTLGVASRTSEINGAKQLLELLNWNKYFQYQEIYPGCKVTHFNNFKRKSGYNYEEMMFFDDERRNIIDVNKLGVTSILVENGMTFNKLRNSLDEYNKQNNIRQ